MKAESILRNGGSNADATNLVNAIRSRAFGGNASKLFASVTLDNIYKVRRFEFAWEGLTRQDQIRFGTFLDAIPQFKPYISDPKYLIYPIPQYALDAQ